MPNNLGGDPTAETAANYDAAADDLAVRYLDPAMLAATRKAFLRRLAANSSIVDIGSGPGRDVALFRDAGHAAVGIERSQRFAAIANRTGHGPVIMGDMRHIPLPSASFDAAWAAGSLVHIPKAEALATAREFRRILKPGGLLCVVVKQGNAEYWRTDTNGQRSFVAPYQPAELDSLLAQAGFKVTHRRITTRDQGGEPRLQWMAKALPAPRGVS